MTGYCPDCGNTMCLCSECGYIELAGRMVDPVVHQAADGTTTIEWPEGATDADWVKVSVPLLRQMNDELNRLRKAPPAVVAFDGELTDADVARIKALWSTPAPPPQEKP